MGVKNRCFGYSQGLVCYIKRRKIVFLRFILTIYDIGIQGVTRNYRWLQGVARGYNGLHGVTRGYRGLQCVTGGYKVLQGVTGGYKGFLKSLKASFLSRTSANHFSRSIFDKHKR